MLTKLLHSTLLLAAAALLIAPAASGHNGVPHDSSAETVQMPFEVNSALVPGSFDCENGTAGPYPCENVDLKGSLPLPTLGGPAGNDIWGWTDPKDGREYAIMGTTNSTGFVDVTDPTNPVLVGDLPTRGTPDFILWRDIKVAGNYAFIVSEITGAGLQVFDLRKLRRTDPDSQGPPIIFSEDASYDEFSNAHNISINEDTGYAYVVGSNTCEINGEAGGLHMVDISEPTEPEFAGCALVDDFSGDEPNNYVHDVECVIYEGPDREHRGREICLGSNENVVAIYDVTDKDNPEVITTRGYPTAEYTHQGSLTSDQRYFLFGDELDEQNRGQPTTTYVLDASDLDDPPVPMPYLHEGSASIDHNLYVHGNRVFESNYAEGLRILEYSNDSLSRGELEEVAFFDVLPGVDIAEFAGTWSNYRFPGSGNVVVSTLENEVNGLLVLDPTLPEQDSSGGEKPKKDKCKGKSNGKGKGGKKGKGKGSGACES